MSRLIFLFSLFLFRLNAYELSVCAIFQNEAQFLDEWLGFHELQGVEHFYLYNNLSQDHYKKILRKYDNITLIDWPFTSTNLAEWIAIQCAAFNDCLAKYGNQSEWIAFLDTDEFLFCPDGRKLTEFLKDYSPYAGVAVNWVMFGTNGVKKIPPKCLMIELLTKRAPLDREANHVIKSIVHTPFNPIFNPDPHLPIANGITVNGNGEPVCSPIGNPVCIDKIRINHYWAKTEDFLLNVKIPRQLKFGISESSVLERNNNMNQESDTAILRFVPDLKKKKRERNEK